MKKAAIAPSRVCNLYNRQTFEQIAERRLVVIELRRCHSCEHRGQSGIDEMQFRCLYQPFDIIARPCRKRPHHENLFGRPQIALRRFAVDLEASAEASCIDRLPVQCCQHSPEARKISGALDIGNIWQVALRDGFGVGCELIAAAYPSVADDGIGVAASQNSPDQIAVTACAQETIASKQAVEKPGRASRRQFVLAQWQQREHLDAPRH